MRRSIEIIICDTEQEYCEEFKAHYVDCNDYIFMGYKVSFDQSDFKHVFYENGSATEKKTNFSTRRARQMHYIRSILRNGIEYELTFEDDRGTIALFCKKLDCVVYLRVRVGTENLEIGSFFDFGRDHTRLYDKQRRKCRPVSAREIQDIIELKRKKDC